jgi:hypothetical protein
MFGVNPLDMESTVDSVKIKFLNWCYYSNTMNAIYRRWTELVRENIYV